MSATETSFQTNVQAALGGAAKAANLAAPAETAAIPPQAVWRVWAVIPCFNRPADLLLLLNDLTRLDLARGTAAGSRAILRVLIVDNASSPPLGDLPLPAELDAQILRLESNTGGSGGFNAGLAAAIARPIEGAPPDFVWMVDSDARVEPGSLLPLLEAMEKNPGMAAAGSALVDPATGGIHEIGGRLNRWTGRFEPAMTPASDGGRGPAELPSLLEVDYIAACSALVRREAIERTGLMPDVFLNADDVEWFIRMGRRAGTVAAVPASRAAHPTFDRFQTWARYYIARNGFGPIDAMGLGPGVRLVRGLREVGRGVLQAMMGRDDLAGLHIAGLKDAAAGRRTGPAPAGRIAFEKFHPLEELGGALKEALGGRSGARVLMHAGVTTSAARISDEALEKLREQLAAAGCGELQACRPSMPGAIWRLAAGSKSDVAIVPARGRPDSWLLGRTTVIVSPEGFVIRSAGRRVLIRSAAHIMVQGLWQSLQLAAGAGQQGAAVLPRATARLRTGRDAIPGASEDGQGAEGTVAQALTLSVVILSYNRWPALHKTLKAFEESSSRERMRIIVVDNGSTDGTPAHLRECHPGIELIELSENRGAGAFNLGAAASSEDLLLILDDDAVPDFKALDAAIDLLSKRPDVAGVALHPRHPATGQSEWPFAAQISADDEGCSECDGWPVMGCGNLVRREAWQRIGGYEDSFFLYRNDVDLAMKLLAAGDGVYFNPAWVVWHDSPAAAKKSLRWFDLAMRNWMWLCRRHGRGVSRLGAMVTGWIWAHKLAGVCPRAHWCTLRGAVRGLLMQPPPLPRVCSRDGKALARLMWLRVGRK